MTVKKIMYCRTHTAVQASCEKHSMEWRLRRVVPAAAVTTHAKPHAQQQLARDLEVERAAMGQRCRPQSFGEVQRGNPHLRRWLDLNSSSAAVETKAESEPATSLSGNL